MFPIVGCSASDSNESTPVAGELTLVLKAQVAMRQTSLSACAMHLIVMLSKRRILTAGTRT